jgi:putative glutamine amidotransferase
VIILIAGLFFLISCESEPQNLKIAVSWVSGVKDSSNYIKWLRRTNPTADYIVMSGLSKDSVDLVFKHCSGLLLTGGEDVFPGRYGQESDTARCGEFNLRRDTLEFGLIEKAIKRKIPILGVCRGHQIINVALGGTLYVDIPTDIKTDLLHQCDDYLKCFHHVKVLPDNILSQLSGIQSGPVTTNHHQAVNKVADDLKVMAVSDDGLIEALGWKNPEGKPFLITVQWHPERMDSTSTLSTPLARAFLEAAGMK